MKKTMLLLAATMTTLVAYPQKLKENDVPSAVKEAFKKQFANAKDVDWEKEDGNYEAEFEIGEIDQSVVLDATGRTVETEIEIKVEELPSMARDYVSKYYANAKITEATKITDEKGVVTYEAEIKSKDLLFDSNGKFLKEKAKTDEDKD